MAETEPVTNEAVGMAEKEETSVQKMDAEVPAANDANGVSKRPREEGDVPEDEENGEDTKKPRVDQSVEEEKKDASVPVSVGSKSFVSSVEMFNYFYKLLHSWSVNLNLNKYEHMILLDLLKKGHSESERKIGSGVRAFQIRFHPQYKSRCFFLVRDDDTVDDFSFRKCVDQIQPLPANMQTKHHANGGGRGGGYGRGRGRGGRSRY
ncbi:hypothetical protein EJD97_005721 [Solanum chilense]|uniref:Uncharacterized protein n=1 Tax=Solanum chilense TaxID=4083 RepID=A0A6N2BRZ8_SOLCI|nr:hypothetical protein EJD97_005721 [Solanum chilense]